MTNWQRISAAVNPLWDIISDTLVRLDDTWTVRLEPGKQWRAYRGEQATLCGFPTIEGAMAEAERLRKEDEGYAS